MWEDASRRHMKRVYVAGPADTKGEELDRTAREIAATGGTPLLGDVGAHQPYGALDAALFAAIADRSITTAGRRLNGLAVPIDDSHYSEAPAQRFRAMATRGPKAMPHISLVHGAPAGGNRAHRPDQVIQGDQ